MALWLKHNKLLLKHLKLFSFWSLSIIKYTKYTKKISNIPNTGALSKTLFSNSLNTSCSPNFKRQVDLNVSNNEKSYRTELPIAVLQSLEYVAHIADLKV
jgi:hypothetical protein